MTMECSRFEDRLDDWVDGGLDETEAATMERHVADCAACRRTLDAQRRLERAVAALPRELEPARDLFPGIRGNIGGRAATRPAWVRWGAVAATLAAGLLAIALGLQWVGGPEPSRPTGESALPVAGSIDDLAAVQAEYERAVSLLLASIEERRETLSPETEAVLTRNLAIIDAAIDEIRGALQREPDAGGEQLLAAMYRQKIELLWTVSRLSS